MTFSVKMQVFFKEWSVSSLRNFHFSSGIRIFSLFQTPGNLECFIDMHAHPFKVIQIVTGTVLKQICQ